MGVHQNSKRSFAQQLQELSFYHAMLAQGECWKLCSEWANWVGCSYKEFLLYPKEYDGKEGTVVLTRWIEKIEYVHDMSGCSIDQKVKYTAGSFVVMMIQEFCPSHEMQKLESKLWNHAMVGAGHAAYTDRFHKLARLVPHLVTPESRMIERYVYCLAPQIRGMVAAIEPKTMQKAVQISGVLTDEAVRNGSIRKVKKRGNVEETSKDKNGRDNNKRTRTGNVFATTVNPVGRENTVLTYVSVAMNGLCVICVYVCCVGYVRFDNQSIERDRITGIGFVLDFVEFISFTFSDNEMILVIEAVSR
ncbi:hypothetical protein Tco_0636704 [Tanacetum coccineum]